MARRSPSSRNPAELIDADRGEALQPCHSPGGGGLVSPVCGQWRAMLHGVGGIRGTDGNVVALVARA
jgi:hypothetical protein